MQNSVMQPDFTFISDPDERFVRIKLNTGMAWGYALAFGLPRVHVHEARLSAREADLFVAHLLEAGLSYEIKPIRTIH